MATNRTRLVLVHERPERSVRNLHRIDRTGVLCQDRQQLTRPRIQKRMIGPIMARGTSGATEPV